MSTYATEKDILNEFVHLVQTNPQRFRITGLTLDDTESKVEFWTGNGMLCTGLYKPVQLDFSLRGKIRFWIWYRRLCRTQVATALLNGSK